MTRLVENVTFDEFVNDIAVYYGTMKNVEIIGEAAYMLTKEFKAMHPETPWDVVQGMRHVLVHDYAQVVPKILWNTATKNIPDIRLQAQKYLDETDWEGCGRSRYKFFSMKYSLFVMLTSLAPSS